MRQVPWESWQQWHHVRRCLASTSPSQIAEALDRVLAWQCRGGLPAAVEITAKLVSVHQRDPAFTAGLSQDAALPEEMLRMMYAMAIQRLVNGVVDQSAKRNTSSVANRAEAAGLPRISVDIRHEAAHDEIPSLPLLRCASKQALAWLQTNYWEEQEQLLLDTQTTLKTKLIEHAQLVFEVLASQQLLVSEEGKGQDHKQQRLILKRALKSVRRQQQALFRDLLELAQFKASDLVTLLVKHGLLVHSFKPVPSVPSPGNVSIDQQSTGDENADQAPVTGGSDIIVRQEDNSIAAWKQTVGQLSEHMPQLPVLLLVSIVEFLTGITSTESSNNSGPKRIPDSSRDLPSFLSCKEQFVGWATWILDRSAAGLKKRKVQIDPAKSTQISVDMEMRAALPQATLKELACKCLRSNMEKDSLVKLVSRMSPLVGDSCFGSRADLLARCCWSPPSAVESPEADGCVEDEEDGNEFIVRYRIHDSARSESGGEEFTSDAALTKARKLQQISLANWAARPKVSKRVKLAKAPSAAGPWSKVKNWTPCAIGMLPSASGCEGVIPQFDFKTKEVSQGVRPAGTQHEAAAVAQGELMAVSSATLKGDNGTKRDLKRKEVEAQGKSDPESDPKRKRGGEPCSISQYIHNVDNREGSSPEQRESENESALKDDTRMTEDAAEHIEPMEVDPAAHSNDSTVNKVLDHAEDKVDVEPERETELEPADSGCKGEDVAIKWQGYLLQRGVLQLGAVQELATMQAAIRVL